MIHLIEITLLRARLLQEEWDASVDRQKIEMAIYGGIGGGI